MVCHMCYVKFIVCNNWSTDDFLIIWTTMISVIDLLFICSTNALTHRMFQRIYEAADMEIPIKFQPMTHVLMLTSIPSKVYDSPRQNGFK